MRLKGVSNTIENVKKFVDAFEIIPTKRKKSTVK